MLDTTLCNSYLSVNLQTIINNMQSIQEDIGPDVECIPVLKDNAYCLGAVPKMCIRDSSKIIGGED